MTLKQFIDEQAEPLMVGIAIGVLLFLGGEYVFDNTSNGFISAAKPAFDSAGFQGTTTKDLAKALNPCLKAVPPIGCEKYIVNGEVFQPPIKIVIDEEKEK